MPKPTWNVAIDLDGDNDFAGTNEDISSLTKAANWRLGFSGPFEPVARPATLSLTLKNVDKRFSPENTSSPIYPNFTVGKKVRIQSTYSGSTFTHFYGWIDSIHPEPGMYKSRLATVECNGFLDLTQKAEVLASASQSVTADVAVNSLINSASILPSFFSINAETGNSTLAIVGDTWGEDTTVYGALTDVVGQEIGKLFVSRSGSVVFWNRNHLIGSTTVAASFLDTLNDMDYRYGQDIINSVVIQANTRTVGASNVTLGQLDNAVKIRANSYLDVTYRYLDQTTGVGFGGISIVAPSASTDYEANTRSDGTGADYTSSVSACVVTEAGGRAEIEYTNAAAEDVWILSGAKVRGLKVTDYGQVEIRKEDSTSIGNYLLRRYTYPYPLDSVSLAESAANYILDRNKDPTGIVEVAVLKAYKDDTSLTQALTRTIGDRISIQESQVGVHKDFFIVGEQFDLNENDLTVSWYLEQADPNAYWIIGVSGFSELDLTTLIGPF